MHGLACALACWLLLLLMCASFVGVPSDSCCPVIAISISDPMAHLLNDVDDVEQHLPGAIKAIREYFRCVTVWAALAQWGSGGRLMESVGPGSGGARCSSVAHRFFSLLSSSLPLSLLLSVSVCLSVRGRRDYKSFSGKINTYALRAQAMPRHYALKVLEETHQHWKNLHFVKKRHIIGESSHQLEGRLSVVKPASVESSPLSVALNAGSAFSPKPLVAGSASPKVMYSAAPSPKLVASQGRQMSAPAMHMGELISAAMQPQAMPQGVGDLTGVEQPMDKLFAERK